jgi:hypothetical protein
MVRDPSVQFLEKICAQRPPKPVGRAPMLDLRLALGRRAAAWVRCVRLAHGEGAPHAEFAARQTPGHLVSIKHTLDLLLYCTIWIYNTLGTTRCCTSVSVVSTSASIRDLPPQSYSHLHPRPEISTTRP